jgi:hypothetical protein
MFCCFICVYFIYLFFLLLTNKTNSEVVSSDPHSKTLLREHQGIEILIGCSSNTANATV